MEITLVIVKWKQAKKSSPSLLNIIMHYNSHGSACSHRPPDSPSNIHRGLSIIVSSLVGFPVGGEQRFTSLVGNMCAKLISTSHAARKHRGFSCTDKKTRHLTKNSLAKLPFFNASEGIQTGRCFQILI